MVEFVARDYQGEGIQSCVDILQSKKKSCREIVIAPTAAGKSWYTAETVRIIDEPIVILQPNRELLLQNFEKYLAVGGEATICCASLKTKTVKGIEYTELEDGSFIRCREVSKVTFATVGSVIKHVEELKKIGVKKMLVDECHLMTQSTTQNVDGKTKEKPAQIKKLMKLIGATNLCGLTATALYLQGGINGATLKMMTRVRWKLFTDIRHVTQIQHLVKNSYWSKLKYQINETDTTILKQNSSGSDYTVESLKDFYEANDLKNQIAEEIDNLKKEGRKSIMVFVSSIDEANELYKMVPNSAIVHSKIDLKTRAFFIKAFKSLEIPVIINVNCLATGFDHLLVDGLITARPTSSIAVFYQQIGRGVRIHPNKKDCKVVDFSGNVSKFGKVEELHYEKSEFWGGWALFNEKNELLTGFPIKATTRPTKESLIKSCRLEQESKKFKIDKEDSPKFWFGKYKDKTVVEVIKENKNYLVWMYGEFDFKGEKMINIKYHMEKELRLPITVKAPTGSKKVIETKNKHFDVPF